jgi:hypothetical protein
MLRLQELEGRNKQRFRRVPTAPFLGARTIPGIREAGFVGRESRWQGLYRAVVGRHGDREYVGRVEGADWPTGARNHGVVCSGDVCVIHAKRGRVEVGEWQDSTAVGGFDNPLR